MDLQIEKCIIYGSPADNLISQNGISTKGLFFCNIGYDYGALDILCHIVYATKGFNLRTVEPKLSSSQVKETVMKIIVVGGGWAGCAAALSACKQGAEVLLIERTDMLLMVTDTSVPSV